MLKFPLVKVVAKIKLEMLFEWTNTETKEYQ